MRTAQVVADAAAACVFAHGIASTMTMGWQPAQPVRPTASCKCV